MALQTKDIQNTGMIQDSSNSYKFIKNLKRGHCASNKLVRKNNDQCAVLKIAYSDPVNENALKTEALILGDLKHPNIIESYGLKIFDGTYFLELEHIDGEDLEDKLARLGKLDEQFIKDAILKLIAALDYLHCQNIVHLDIKASNVMVDYNGRVKLIDLGNGQIIGTVNGLTRLVNVYKSTLGENAPEVLNHRPYDGKKADIWSVGALMFQLITGKTAFSTSDFRNNLLTDEFIIERIDSSCEISELAKDLTKQLLKVNPVDRLGLECMKDHPWFDSPDSTNNLV